MIKLFNHWLRLRTVLQIATDFSFVMVGIIAAVMWVGSRLTVDLPVVIACSLALALTTLALNAWLGFYDRAHNRSVLQSLMRAGFSLMVAALFAYAIFGFAPLTGHGRELRALGRF